MSTKRIAYKDESVLLAALIQRNETAFTYFYEKNRRRCFVVIYNIVHRKEVAEDLVQDAFIRFYDKLHLYKPTPSGLRAWMYVICRNLAYSFVSNDKLHRFGCSIDDEQHGEAITYLVNQHLASYTPDPVLENSVIPWHKLSPINRQILELRYYGGLSYLELVRHLNIPMHSVKNQLHMAKRQLRALLPPNSYEVFLTQSI